uniref:Uncharacterized protein n=1 Tax=Vitrella brassicaformis TaxID=1169539 RepID=A0A7S1PD65_9ALVE|mmetsp:Transcript_54067/g.135998  ORF Transcript_54067/g.135998 Transcript_54067/m.135998 type:complete len:528 (+) Transcript_54067:83-1666(+)
MCSSIWTYKHPSQCKPFVEQTPGSVTSYGVAAHAHPASSSRPLFRWPVRILPCPPSGVPVHGSLLDAKNPFVSTAGAGQPYGPGAGQTGGVAGQSYGPAPFGLPVHLWFKGKLHAMPPPDVVTRKDLERVMGGVPLSEFLLAVIQHNESHARTWLQLVLSSRRANGSLQLSLVETLLEVALFSMLAPHPEGTWVVRSALRSEWAQGLPATKALVNNMSAEVVCAMCTHPRATLCMQALFGSLDSVDKSCFVQSLMANQTLLGRICASVSGSSMLATIICAHGKSGFHLPIAFFNTLILNAPEILRLTGLNVYRVPPANTSPGPSSPPPPPPPVLLLAALVGQPDGTHIGRIDGSGDRRLHTHLLSLGHATRQLIRKAFLATLPRLFARVSHGKAGEGYHQDIKYALLLTSIVLQSCVEYGGCEEFMEAILKTLNHTGVFEMLTRGGHMYITNYIDVKLMCAEGEAEGRGGGDGEWGSETSCDMLTGSRPRRVYHQCRHARRSYTASQGTHTHTHMWAVVLKAGSYCI